MFEHADKFSGFGGSEKEQSSLYEEVHAWYRSAWACSRHLRCYPLSTPRLPVHIHRVNRGHSSLAGQPVLLNLGKLIIG